MQIFISSPFIIGRFCVVHVLNADIAKISKKVALRYSLASSVVKAFHGPYDLVDTVKFW